MKRTVFLLLALIGWFALPLHAAAPSQPPTLHSLDGHRLAERVSPTVERVWFPTGFYGGALNMSTAYFLDQGDFKAPEVAFRAFIDKLAAANLNFARFWVNYGMIPSDPAGSDWDYKIIHPYELVETRGRPKVDLDRFNDAYFSMLAREVAYARSKGIVLQLALFDCWHVTWGSPYAERDYFRAENNTSHKGISWTNVDEWFSAKHPISGYQELFVEQVVAAIGNQPNIIWETCNEDLRRTGLEPGDAKPVLTAPKWDWDRRVAQWIADAESAWNFPHHLVVPIDLPEHRTVAGHMTPTAPLSTPQEESMETMRGRLKVQHSWDLPLITDNDCCNPPRGDYEDIPRVKAWAALTAGAHSDFFIDVLSESDLMTRSDITRGMREVGYIQSFLSGLVVNLVGMEPHDSLATVSNGAPSAWVYARPGDEYIVYLRAHTGSRSVSLGQLPPSYNARWFNPRSGTITVTTGGPTFLAPENGDMVLYVRKTNPPPLAIASQPTSEVAFVGSSVSFSTAASGGLPPYSFRWQYRGSSSGTWSDLNDGSGVLGATTATLTLVGVNASRGGEYRVRVNDSNQGSVVSSAASLTVVTPLAIGSSPTSQWVATGTSASFTATVANGLPPYTYRWQFSQALHGTYADIGNPTPSSSPSSTYSIAAAGAAQAGFYRLSVTDAMGSFGVSSAARLGLKCVSSLTALCLQENRFKVEVQYFQSGQSYPAKVPVLQNFTPTASGYFYFFSADNVELGVKVLAGENAWWVFYGVGTDVGFRITVTDTKNHDAQGLPVQKIYTKAQGGFCGQADTNAFPKDYATPPSLPGDPEPHFSCPDNSPTTICQINNRFKIQIFLLDSNGQRLASGPFAGPRTAVALDPSTGAFWFYSPENLEVFIRVLTGTNQRYWVYYGSQSDQPYEIEVTDTWRTTTPTRVYRRPGGDLCGGGDAFAFPFDPNLPL